MNSSIDEIIKLTEMVLAESESSMVLDGLIQEISDRVELIDFPREQFSILILLNRIIQLSKEKCADIGVAKYGDDDLVEL